MKNYLIIFILGFLTFSNTFGAKITDDVLKVGLPGSAADKTLKLGDSRLLRSNETSGVLEFSNDSGALWKKIGSGSGSGGSGGVNVLLNAGAEDGLTNWTNTGGTLTQESYTNSTEDNTKFFRFVATGSGQYVDSDLITFPDFIKGGCMADMKYVQGDNVFILKVIDQVPDEKSTGDLSDLTDWQKSPTQAFNCPTQGKIRIQSTGAGTIDFDDAYLGSNKGFIASESHASVIAYTPVTDGFGTISSTFFTYQLVGEMLHINGKFTTGTVDGNTAKVNLPSGFIIDNKGVVFNMIVGVHATYQTSSESGGLSLALDGDNFITFTSKRVFSNTAGSIGSDTGINTSASTRSFSFTAVVSVSSPEINNAQEAFTPEQADFFIDVNIGGANVNIFTNTNPTTLINGSLNMVLNKGSAKIPCESSNPVTGLTCSSGSEQVGIVFNAPRAGKYKVCASFISQVNGSTTYRIAETTNQSDTIIQQGKSISGHYLTQSSSVNCDFFDVSSIGEKTFKVFYESTNTGLAVLERATTEYLRDAHITVELVSHNVSRPVIQDMVTTSVSSGIRVQSCSITRSASPTVDTSDCNSWLDSLGDVSAGITDFNIKTGIFSEKPTCTGNCNLANNCEVIFDAANWSTTLVRAVTQTNNTAATFNAGFGITCIGAK